ncbi:MAG: SpoIIIAH-like family protein [Oscillospiraceae bacterium]
MKKAKRNIIITAVLLLVCAAVYLNWSYNNRWGNADAAMVEAEDDAMAASSEGEKDATQTSEYFSEARLTRQISRDEALTLLQTAASSEAASQETIDSAMNAIAAMATWSMQETQMENMLIAKDFTDCVVYMSSEGVTVAVPAPVEGLSETQVAQITDAITAETEYEATQIKVIEIKDGVTAQKTALTEPAGEVPAAD